MALDLHAARVVSDEPERKFSETGAAISPRRRLFDEQTIAWLTRLKNRSNTGLVTSNKALFAEMPASLTTITSETSPIPLTGRIQTFYPGVNEQAPSRSYTNRATMRTSEHLRTLPTPPPNRCLTHCGHYLLPHEQPSPLQANDTLSMCH